MQHRLINLQQYLIYKHKELYKHVDFVWLTSRITILNFPCKNEPKQGNLRLRYKEKPVYKVLLQVNNSVLLQVMPVLWYQSILYVIRQWVNHTRPPSKTKMWGYFWLCFFRVQFWSNKTDRYLKIQTHF